VSRIETVPIDKIHLNRRIRRDMGDLQNLMDSLKRNGLLNPIVVTDTYQLVAGQRRLESAKLLGWRAIPCRIVDTSDKADLLQIEIDENMARKDFSSDELADALLRLDRLKNPPWWRRLLRAIRRFFRFRRS
jgi:ParB family transcriptional regulator, chromosome partitioning protein